MSLSEPRILDQKHPESSTLWQEKQGNSNMKTSIYNEKGDFALQPVIGIKEKRGHV